MVRNRRFNWGHVYLLTDLKDGVFVDEPAVCVGKKDCDENCPNMCAVCGQPLKSTNYSSFCMRGIDGHFLDVMIGSGCIKERIREKETDIYDRSPYGALIMAMGEFPTTGRWYGTFLHHCIAKPYVRNKKIIDCWDNSILKLPGVRYIIDTIDNLRDAGWSLDAEMRLDCGNIDLLAMHPDKGTIVYDWKSDLCFDNVEAYRNQINQYMFELNKAGYGKISGYILWIRDKRKEEVPFTGIQLESNCLDTRSKTHSFPIKCTLTIEMNGGTGIRKKKMTEYSHHRIYGDQVGFYIPLADLYKPGYELAYFEASPYRDGEREQLIADYEIEDGFWINFICSKKRHSFNLAVYWKKKRPYLCLVVLKKIVKDQCSTLAVFQSMSKINEEKKDYVELDVSEINHKLENSKITHAIFIDESGSVKMEWGPKELQNGMKICIPLINECSNIELEIDTVTKPKKKKETISEIKPLKQNEIEFISKNEPVKSSFISKTVLYPEYPVKEKDLAEMHFTPGRIYESGRKLYGIYKRVESDKPNTVGKVYVAEVDCTGRKISKLMWRHVYTTHSGKEYIYGLTNPKWIIYTKNAFVGLSPCGMGCWEI